MGRNYQKVWRKIKVCQHYAKEEENIYLPEAVQPSHPVNEILLVGVQKTLGTPSCYELQQENPVVMHINSNAIICLQIQAASNNQK